MTCLAFSLILTSSFDRLEEIFFNRVSKVEDVHKLDFVDTKLQTKHGHKYREWCGLCRPNSTCKHDTKSQVWEIYKDAYFSGEVRDKKESRSLHPAIQPLVCYRIIQWHRLIRSKKTDVANYDRGCHAHGHIELWIKNILDLRPLDLCPLKILI